MAESINPTIIVTKKSVPHTFTANGTYNTPPGLSYDPVTVAVEGGGTGTVDEELIVTENGTYWAEDGIRPYPVVVDVPAADEEEEITITENGVYTPPQGKKYAKITVQVQAQAEESGISAAAVGFFEIPEIQAETVLIVPGEISQNYGGIENVQ